MGRSVIVLDRTPFFYVQPKPRTFKGPRTQGSLESKGPTPGKTSRMDEDARR